MKWLYLNFQLIFIGKLVKTETSLCYSLLPFVRWLYLTHKSLIWQKLYLLQSFSRKSEILNTRLSILKLWKQLCWKCLKDKYCCILKYIIGLVFNDFRNSTGFSLNYNLELQELKKKNKPWFFLIPKPVKHKKNNTIKGMRC